MHENVKNLNNQYSLKMRNKSERLTLYDYDSYLKATVSQHSVISIEFRNRYTYMPQSSQGNTIEKEQSFDHVDINMQNN